jgi:fermentation-respiration switch protein FrsA (DUF1100 family)
MNVYLSTDSPAHYEHVKPKGKSVIHCWHLNRYPNSKTILYFHGNSYNISYREYMLKICELLKLNLIMADYQGYGDSTGKPSSIRILEDAITISKYAINKCDPKEIIIWGESLGGTPSILSAAYINPYALILFSTFDSLHGLLNDSILHFVAKIVTSDINEDTNNSLFIKKVLCPILVLHSKEDDLIPYNNAIGLYNSISHLDKRFERISGVHSDPKLSKLNIETMISFLGLDISKEQVEGMRDIINNLGW